MLHVQDKVSFPLHVPGVTYVTANLTSGETQMARSGIDFTSSLRREDKIACPVKEVILSSYDPG